MQIETVGFIGSGRVAAFMAEGFRRAGKALSVTLADADPAVSRRLAAAGWGRDAGIDFRAAAASDLVFLALHPQAAAAGAAAIAGALAPRTIVVSLAPKVRLGALRAALGTDRIARFLPSAPSALGAGYNPIAFSDAFPQAERAAVRDLLGALGAVPEADEPTLEAYAVLCAMGPTYLWPIFDAMAKLGAEFGLDGAEARTAIARTAAGAAALFGEDGRSFESLMDMIPSKPMAEDEGQIRQLFGERLRGMYAKLTS